jgi:hypothetical protein
LAALIALIAPTALTALAAPTVVTVLAVLTVSTATGYSTPALAAESPDECEFIRVAIQALPAQGGEVRIPEGTFNCRNMVVIRRDNVILRGAGQDRTILRLGDYAHAPVLVIGDERTVLNERGEWVTPVRVAHIVVRDLTVDGNVANQDPTKECGEEICNGDTTTVRNSAITIRGASDVTVRDVTAHSSISGGMVTEKYCDHLNIVNFTSHSNYFDGFAGYQTVDSRFENIDLSRNRMAGISIDIEFNHNVFSGGRLEDNGDVGIFARDLVGVKFENLAISRSGNHGVFLAQSEGPDTCADNVEMNNVLVEGSRGHGIHLASPCRGNKLTGNSILKKNSLGCLFVNAKTIMQVDSTVVCED